MKHMFKYENNLWNSNINVIVGVDEVGRGPLAGPIVTCAVGWTKEIIENILKIPYKKELLLLVNDSKKLSEKKRNLLSDFIKKECLNYSMCELPSDEIDKNGVGETNKKALICAVSALSKKIQVGHVLIDYFSVCDELNIPETAIKKGDQLSFSIASASIIAKVYRDKLMRKYHTKFPQYGFDTNVGYGTKKHIQAIKKYGYSPIHRRSFKIKIN